MGKYAQRSMHTLVEGFLVAKGWEEALEYLIGLEWKRRYKCDLRCDVTPNPPPKTSLAYLFTFHFLLMSVWFLASPIMVGILLKGSGT